MSDNNWPLGIEPKVDLPSRIEQLEGVPDKYWYPAMQINLVHEKIQELIDANPGATPMTLIKIVDKQASLNALETAFPVAAQAEYTAAFHDSNDGRFWMKVGTAYVPYAPLNQPKASIPRTTSFTISASMHDGYIECNNATGITATVPVNATTAIAVGTYITVMPNDDGRVVFESETGVVIEVEDGYLKETRAKKAPVMLRKTAINTWVLFGALKTV